MGSKFGGSCNKNKTSNGSYGYAAGQMLHISVF